jgi:hypothetical protein
VRRAPWPWWAGGLSGIAGGALFIATDVLDRVSPDPDYWDCNSSWDYGINGVATAANLVLVGALFGVHERQKRAVGVPGRLAVVTACLGTVTVGVANVFEHCASIPAAPFVVGVLLSVLGLSALGTVTLRAAELPRWFGAALLLTVPALFLGDSGGLIAFGLIWIALGVALLVLSTGRPRALAH